MLPKLEVRLSLCSMLRYFIFSNFLTKPLIVFFISDILAMQAPYLLILEFHTFFQFCYFPWSKFTFSKILSCFFLGLIGTSGSGGDGFFTGGFWEGTFFTRWRGKSKTEEQHLVLSTFLLDMLHYKYHHQLSKSPLGIKWFSHNTAWVEGFQSAVFVAVMQHLSKSDLLIGNLKEVVFCFIFVNWRNIYFT